MPKFHCIHCGQRIDAVQEWAGKQVNCPSCAGAIVVPGLEDHQNPHSLQQTLQTPASSQRSSQKKGTKKGCLLYVIVFFLLLPIYVFFQEAGAIVFVPMCMIAWLIAYAITEQIQK